jgi:hypothetical protein
VAHLHWNVSVGWLARIEARDKDEAQNCTHPGKDEAKVLSDGAEDDVGRVAGAAFEIAAAEDDLRPSYDSMTGSMAERRLSSRLIMRKTPRF